MKYFTLFPKLNYSFSNGQYLTVTNLFIRPEIELTEIPGINVFGNKYTVEDGVSPDKIADELYENSNLFWCVLRTNNIFNFYKEWPVSFDLWKKELSNIHGKYTLFTPYFMDIKRGDIITKYIPNNTQFFDENNFGIVTEINSFLRSFDVDFIKGQINEQEQFVVLRKQNTKYIVIKTPSGDLYQNLLKKQEKLNSTINFFTNDKNSKEKTSISPYSVIDQNRAISSKIDNIIGTGCVLDNFLSNTLPVNIITFSFMQDSQKEWLFTKTINVIPDQYLSQISEIYLNELTT